MSNSWFQFRRFRIDQGNCGMKVSTDACIQGAWTPVPARARTALDIGAGSGLLTLMLAQRFPALRITAIELDAAAAAQAAANAGASPWADRIAVSEGDARTLPPGQFDFIICNPPFFNRSLQSPDAARNRARHSLTLTQNDLLSIFDSQLVHGGAACILLPVAEHEQWIALALGSGWFLQSALYVQDNPDKAAGRIVSIWARGPLQQPSVRHLQIRDREGAYTGDFSSLLRPFYLHL